MQTVTYVSPMPLQLSPPSSPINAPFRRSLKDLLRWVFLTCVLLLTGVTFSNLQYLQRTVDSFEIETLPSLFSSNQDVMSNVRRTKDHLRTARQRVSRAALSQSTQTTTVAEDNLPCLVHEKLAINASSKRVSDPNQTILQPLVATKCGNLKRKWLYNPPISKMARILDHHQSNCSLPTGRHYFDNTFGLGAHFILWGQGLCNALQDSNPTRIQSQSPETWLWLDQTHCNLQQAKEESPLSCYFPGVEGRCDHRLVEHWTHRHNRIHKNVSDPRNQKLHCPLVRDPDTRPLVRAAATEILFQRISPLVIQEAKRQVGFVFASNGGNAPDDLITVHIRWGDKFWEMDLPSIDEYVEAVHNLTHSTGYNETSTNILNNTSVAARANIYLATEDPRAYEAFMAAKPPEWTVYADITLLEINAFRPKKGNRASWATRNTKGRAGLLAMGSLLVAMEANQFVLTTKSNWSTLMNHLRTNILDPRCGNCTEMIDLRPGIY